MGTALRLQRDQGMVECIESCTRCAEICLETVEHCLRQGGEHAAEAHVRLLLDCAQICRTSADFMIRGSDLHAETCGACEVVCSRCAEDCDRFRGDEQMAACADLCRRCAESCGSMAAHG